MFIGIRSTALIQIFFADYLFIFKYMEICQITNNFVNGDVGLGCTLPTTCFPLPICSGLTAGCSIILEQCLADFQNLKYGINHIHPNRRTMQMQDRGKYTRRGAGKILLIPTTFNSLLCQKGQCHRRWFSKKIFGYYPKKVKIKNSSWKFLPV